MNIAILLSSFNRAGKTSNCIRTLSNQHHDIDFYLVDDGSTDTTVDDVKAEFPFVNIISGSGSLYWAGAMRLGWSKISQKNYDALIVVNDDVQFYIDAIENAITDYNEIIKSNDDIDIDFALVGSTNYFNNPELVSYGGQKRSSFWHPLKFKIIQPTSEIQEAITLNMNFAIIPIKTIDKFGFLESYFLHGGADFEFGLRLIKNRGKVFIMRGFVGSCDRNPERLYSSNIKERFKEFHHPKNQPFSQRIKYFKTYGGLLWPFLFVLPYVKLIFGLHRQK
jgi:GT2 family glycosyltransferase